MLCPTALRSTAQCGCIALSALLRCLLSTEEELHAVQECVWLLCCAVREVHGLPTPSSHPPWGLWGGQSTWGTAPSGSVQDIVRLELNNKPGILRETFQHLQ